MNFAVNVMCTRLADKERNGIALGAEVLVSFGGFCANHSTMLGILLIR